MNGITKKVFSYLFIFAMLAFLACIVLFIIILAKYSPILGLAAVTLLGIFSLVYGNNNDKRIQNKMNTPPSTLTTALNKIIELEDKIEQLKKEETPTSQKVIKKRTPPADNINF